MSPLRRPRPGTPRAQTWVTGTAGLLTSGSSPLPHLPSASKRASGERGLAFRLQLRGQLRIFTAFPFHRPCSRTCSGGGTYSGCGASSREKRAIRDASRISSRQAADLPDTETGMEAHRNDEIVNPPGCGNGSRSAHTAITRPIQIPDTTPFPPFHR